MNKQSPIGIFDSGVGGTSIWKEIHALLPYEETIYLADSKNAPYGQKPSSEIIELSIKNTDKLLEMGAKIIIVACNTATTNAIEVLRNTYTVPFIGIEPAIKPAALQTKTKQIGILATKGTLRSSLFTKTSELYTQNIQVTEVIGEGLVPLIENGNIHSQEMDALLRKYLDPMIAAKIDYLVLGCSHYPYLIPHIKQILPDHVKIIDSGEAVARQTKNILEKFNLLADSREPKLQFYTNFQTNTITELLRPLKNNMEIGYLDF